jgi:cyanate lyase
MARTKPRPAPADSRPLTDELLAAIRDEGATDYELAHRTGLAREVIRRFRLRQRSLTLDSADRLARALGLGMVRIRTPRKGPKKKAPDGA